MSTLTSLAARIDPDNGRARELLRDELGSGVYREHQDPLQWLVAKVLELWDRLVAGSDGQQTHAIPDVAVVALVLAGLALVVLTLRYVRRDHTAKAPVGAVLGDEALTAAEYRERARSALAAGDTVGATLDGVRWLARDAQERTLLPDLPSLTAHEIAGLLARPFPDDASALRSAAGSFDDAAYGDRVPSRDEAAAVLALAEALERRRPVLDTGTELAGLSAGAPGSAVTTAADPADADAAFPRGGGR